MSELDMSMKSITLNITWITVQTKTYELQLIYG